jgi:hypothetical protein
MRIEIDRSGKTFPVIQSSRPPVFSTLQEKKCPPHLPLTSSRLPLTSALLAPCSLNHRGHREGTEKIENRPVLLCACRFADKFSAENQEIYQKPCPPQADGSFVSRQKNIIEQKSA